MQTTVVSYNLNLFRQSIYNSSCEFSTRLRKHGTITTTRIYTTSITLVTASSCSVRSILLIVFARYHLLSARHVDLVGDYAGSELFIIEGDSLLQRCLAEPELDFEGWQSDMLSKSIMD